MVGSAGDLEGFYGAGSPGCSNRDTDSTAYDPTQQPVLAATGAAKQRTVTSLSAALARQITRTAFTLLDPAPTPHDKIDLSIYPHPYKGDGDA